MKEVKKHMDKKINPVGKIKMVSEQYVQALMETIRGPILILDSKLRVVEVNESFCAIFKVDKKETENKLVYELGNGQWDVPALKKLLENVLPSKKVVKDYEVEDNFPTIGMRVMLVNACQIDSLQLILASFEDVTVERRIEKKSMEYNRALTKEVSEKTKQLANRIKELEEVNQSMIGRELKMVELKKELDSCKVEKFTNNDKI